MNKYSIFIIVLGLFCVMYGWITELDWGIYWMFTGFLCEVVVVISDLILTPEWHIACMCTKETIAVQSEEDAKKPNYCPFCGQKMIRDKETKQ